MRPSNCQAPALGALIAWATLATARAEDLRITAEAMHAFDPEQVLPSIGIPALLVVGDQDIYLEDGETEQAAQLIPDCTLRVYPDTNHVGAITSPRFAADTREFIRHDHQKRA